MDTDVVLNAILVVLHVAHQAAAQLHVLNLAAQHHHVILAHHVAKDIVQYVLHANHVAMSHAQLHVVHLAAQKLAHSLVLLSAHQDVHHVAAHKAWKLPAGKVSDFGGVVPPESDSKNQKLKWLGIESQC